MALWKVEPVFKKSCIERQTYTKDGKSITEELGWRWGEFTIETEDDSPPELEEGVDMFSCGYELIDFSTNDGCWTDYEYSGMTEEEILEMQEWFDEGNSLYELEEDGWNQGDGEMIINCEMTIEKVE
jgi:hypothetical protein